MERHPQRARRTYEKDNELPKLGSESQVPAGILFRPITAAMRANGSVRRTDGGEFDVDQSCRPDGGARCREEAAARRRSALGFATSTELTALESIGLNADAWPLGRCGADTSPAASAMLHVRDLNSTPHRKTPDRPHRMIARRHARRQWRHLGGARCAASAGGAAAVAAIGVRLRIAPVAQTDGWRRVA